jgi:hypothetical protein
MVSAKVIQAPFFYLHEMADNRVASTGCFTGGGRKIDGYYINGEDHLRGLLHGKFYNIEPK